jgi:hypothetical protein
MTETKYDSPMLVVFDEKEVPGEFSHFSWVGKYEPETRGALIFDSAFSRSRDDATAWTNEHRNLDEPGDAEGILSRNGFHIVMYIDERNGERSIVVEHNGEEEKEEQKP